MAIFPPRHLLLRTEPTPEEVPLQHLFVALHSISLILLTSLTAIILVARLKRHPILFSLFAAFSLNDIMNLLLAHQPLYANWGLCLISQAGTTAGTALATTNVMSLVALTWSLLMERAGKKLLSDRFFYPLLIWLPWVVGFVVFVISIVTTSMRPDDLTVTVLTCYAQNVYTDVLHGVAVIAILAAFVFDIWGIVLFAKNYFKTRSFGSQVDVEVGQVVTRPNLNRTFTIRVLVFGLAVAAALAAAVIIIVQPASHLPALFQASIGLICFALFGTQRDIYEALKIPYFFSSTARFLTCSSSSLDTFSDLKTPQDTLPPLPPNPPPSGATTPAERRRRFSRSSGGMSFGAMFRSTVGGVEERRDSLTVMTEGGREESIRKGSDASKESEKVGESIELEGEMVAVAVLLSDGGNLERPPLMGGSSDGSGSGSGSSDASASDASPATP